MVFLLIVIYDVYNLLTDRNIMYMAKTKTELTELTMVSSWINSA